MIVLLCWCMYIDLSPQMVACSFKEKGWGGGASVLAHIYGKESACSTGDPDSIPGSSRSPREGNGNLLQYSYLENSIDRGC